MPSVPRLKTVTLKGALRRLQRRLEFKLAMLKRSVTTDTVHTDRRFWAFSQSLSAISVQPTNLGSVAGYLTCRKLGMTHDNGRNGKTVD